jgi:hypothetical protein
MAYWLDEGWHRWPEIVEAGTAAAGLYSRCGSYIADCTTDGFVPSGVARMYGTPEWIQRLVEVGLWTVDEKGFWDTRYFPLNKTKEDIERKKKQHADRQARYYAKVTAQTRKPRGSSASSDASVTRPPIPPPTGDRARGKAQGHPFADDGSGVCSECNLIEVHRNHVRAVDGRAS